MALVVIIVLLIGSLMLVKSHTKPEEVACPDGATLFTIKGQSFCALPPKAM